MKNKYLLFTSVLYIIWMLSCTSKKVDEPIQEEPLCFTYRVRIESDEVCKVVIIYQDSIHRELIYTCEDWEKSVCIAREEEGFLMVIPQLNTSLEENDRKYWSLNPCNAVLTTEVAYAGRTLSSTVNQWTYLIFNQRIVDSLEEKLPCKFFYLNKCF